MQVVGDLVVSRRGRQQAVERDAGLSCCDAVRQIGSVLRVVGGEEPAEAHDPPLLYDLDQDPGEKYDVAARHPDVIAAIREIAARHARTMAHGSVSGLPA